MQACREMNVKFHTILSSTAGKGVFNRK